MVIILNIDCCGGKGLQKWNQIKDQILDSETEVLQTNEPGFIDKLKEYIEKCETHFVAAGGDGTVNYLLNNLVGSATHDQFKNITIGAIGIGSSNDFHKPFRSKSGEIPICIDFQNAYLRDAGVIKYDSDKGKVEKYFLINASVGITAEANNLFNKPDFILRKLKQFNTKIAIFYSAIKTIMTYRNLSAEIIIDGDKLKTKVSNLGITKNPHFSGDFCYDSQTDYYKRKSSMSIWRIT
ncbi:MAG: hypothetical protein MZV64_69650 [Ignavibacteriales bacterium]|nr:hypothetical protein [Ignavibacteriales bacterium]